MRGIGQIKTLLYFKAFFGLMMFLIPKAWADGLLILPLSELVVHGRSIVFVLRNQDHVLPVKYNRVETLKIFSMENRR